MTMLSIHSTTRRADQIPRRMRNRSAFTLVELLVVIGIIAILIGLLMPALARAREQARTIVCAAKIHQIGVASLAYANRNQGYLPVPVPGPSNKGGLPESAIWSTDKGGILDFTQGTLIPDLGGPQVAEELFKCPSHDEPRQLSAFHDVPFMAVNFDYVFNWDIVSGYNVSGPDHPGWQSRKINQIRSPARKILLFENGDCAAENCAPVAYGPFTGYPQAHLFIAVRHHNRSNVFCADGHVELFDSLTLKDDTITKHTDSPVYVMYFQLLSE
jgi:prepilin-type N-terminal cleavage/methylation domain-containing protein